MVSSLPLDQPLTRPNPNCTDLRTRLEASHNEVIYLKDKLEGGASTRRLTGTKRDISSNSGYRINSPSRVSKGEDAPSTSSSSVVPFYITDNWLVNFRSEIQKCIDGGWVRVISLNECKEQLDRLCEGKSAANAKALRTLDASGSFQVSYGMPILTMEEYFYHSFERKFGLRGIAIEQAARLLQAVQKYSQDDFLVNIFQLIMRNELNEEFWAVQRDLASGVRDLVALRIMNRSPDITKAALAEELNVRMGGAISDGEWAHIVNYLYSSTDSILINTTLCKRARRLGSAISGLGDKPAAPLSAAKSAQRIAPAWCGKRAPKSEKKERVALRLPFFIFIATLQDFQLRSQLHYLEKFHKAFTYYDRDGDGILKPDELAACLLLLHREMGGTQSGTAVDYAGFLKAADPLASGRVTFSMATTSLSKTFI